MNTSGVRLPAVPSLSELLPKGTEGGKEFARVVGLLLLNETRSMGLEFNLFDDASGDYEGLDSFSRKSGAKEVVGYQYKFFKGPLSNEHRQEIQVSVKHAIARSNRLKLVKWVLVTPDDFKNSATRKGGGDVDWFEALKESHKGHVVIEHIGHSALQNLFLKAPHLCLFYYPVLVPSGLFRRKSIDELRVQYDENMRVRFGRVEFVGMSVYKEETSRRIPLENIYIPLSAVNERAPDEDDDTPRVDPARFLSRGAKTVLLGDPGSGKSTMMTFLALVGSNPSLQLRSGFVGDKRLPVIVTLRRYADELKIRKNLPILDYILEVAQADFNINGLEKSFYEFYVETGQAIVLFDGLDELPGAHFKRIVKQRIESFQANFPANTIVVTSRIVGYEKEIRLDESYGHYRVAKLRVVEIEKFVADWYAVRIEDTAERQKNALDLVKVITNPDGEAIRELARNPLLLTIVALVHRIDAVLPDQRVVLYQKCTETLLNTWYKSKKRDEENIKGRVERHNRLRIEAIAYWMHTRSVGEKGRSVAPRLELIEFLTKYINSNESFGGSEEPAEDQAEFFIDFIRNSAGLLVEVGDGMYSFIHLTFQEYLCATHLAAFGEVGGVKAIWEELKGKLHNPRWREVVRLLVASLRSITGQAFFVDQLLDESRLKPSNSSTLLTLGLLRDAIEPAELRAIEIVERTLSDLLALTDKDEVRLTESALLSWVAKDLANIDSGALALDQVFDTVNSANQLTLTLIAVASGLGDAALMKYPALDCDLPDKHLLLLRSLIFVYPDDESDAGLLQSFDSLNSYWSSLSPTTNAIAALGLCIANMVSPNQAAKRLLLREITLRSLDAKGPRQDNLLNLLALALPAADMHPALKLSLRNAIGPHSRSDEDRHIKMVDPLFEFFLGADYLEDKADEHKLRSRLDSRVLKRLQSLSRPITKKADLKWAKNRNNELDDLYETRVAFASNMDENPSFYVKLVLSSESFSSYTIFSLGAWADLNSLAQWEEALRATLETAIPIAIAPYFDQKEWLALEARLLLEVSDQDAAFATWLIFLEIWVVEHGGCTGLGDSPLRSLMQLLEGVRHPAVRFGMALRDIFHGRKGGKAKLKGVLDEEHAFISSLLYQAGWPISVLTRRGSPKLARNKSTIGAA